MNQSTTTTWSPMIAGPDEDFANFLEFSDLQLNFPAFDTEAQDATTDQIPNHGLDTTMETGGGMVGMKGDIQHQIDPNLLPMQASMAETRSLHSSTDALLDMNMQAQIFHHQQLQYHQQRRVQNLYHTQGMVPPTPSSLEIHGQPRSYPQMDPHARAMYEHYARKDHVSFCKQLRLFSSKSCSRWSLHHSFHQQSLHLTTSSACQNTRHPENTSVRSHLLHWKRRCALHNDRYMDPYADRTLQIQHPQLRWT